MEKKNMNNKGFSLVELIIVIAIMAVLIGVLAPQYIKYVEKGRESGDLENYQTIIDALQINAADPDATTTVAAGTMTFTKGANPTLPTEVVTIMKSQSANPEKMTMKSNKYGSANVKIDVSTGVPQFSTDNQALADALGITKY